MNSPILDALARTAARRFQSFAEAATSVLDLVHAVAPGERVALAQIDWEEGTCRIADASVMQTIIRGHTHAPILLAAARGNPAAHKGFELRRKRIGRQQLRKQFGLGHLGAEHQVDRDVMIGAVLD